LVSAARRRLWEAQGASDKNVAIRWVAVGAYGIFAAPGRSCCCRHNPASLLLTFAQELEMHPATLAIVPLFLVPPAAGADLGAAEVADDRERG
jgi:hypothetical protein